jgi:hypothetical protein
VVVIEPRRSGTVRVPQHGQQVQARDAERRAERRETPLGLVGHERGLHLLPQRERDKAQLEPVDRREAVHLPDHRLHPLPRAVGPCVPPVPEVALDG